MASKRSFSSPRAGSGQLKAEERVNIKLLSRMVGVMWQRLAEQVPISEDEAVMFGDPAFVAKFVLREGAKFDVFRRPSAADASSSRMDAMQSTLDSLLKAMTKNAEQRINKAEEASTSKASSSRSSTTSASSSKKQKLDKEALRKKREQELEEARLLASSADEAKPKK